MSDPVVAAFDFPRHPLARDDGERLRGAFRAPPARWLRATRADELAGVIDAAHAAARAGAWVLGGLRYEAAGALDAALASQAAPAGMPLAEFAVFEQAPDDWPAPAAPARVSGPWFDTQAEAAEAAQIEAIRAWIRAGDCYQVNLTTRLDATLEAVAPFALFEALHAQQPGGFSLFLDIGAGASVASVSPELFFDWRPVPGAERSWLLATQPMKGTAPRGADRAADEAAQTLLRTSEKERAENLMIVDLLRNDLSRVARLGSVRVPRLFELHALPTVWQMTSTVSAASRAGLALSEVFAALFPCGSVTGAPKVRAMQIIRDLESAARGWYCGALGLIQPGGVATFNVPIRTVEVQDRALRCGVGSAITLDSTAVAEIAEWRAKARFLVRAAEPFAALETMRLEPGGVVPRLELHLARLQRTARQFGLRWTPARVREAIAAAVAAKPHDDARLRLLLQADGTVAAEVLPLPPTPDVVQLALADVPIDARGPAAEFLRHKTTRREAYAPFAAARPAAAFDVILFNEAGELTECTFGNLALELDGRWLTPHAAAGLLPGVMREQLLREGRIVEARLTRADLARATRVAFFNSLRGWLAATRL